MTRNIYIKLKQMLKRMIWEDEGWNEQWINNSGLPVELFGARRSRKEVVDGSRDWLMENSSESRERMTGLVGTDPIEDDDAFVPVLRS